jgi:hypothetical protein
VQQRPTVPTTSRQKEVTTKKSRQTDRDRSILIKCVESGQACDTYKASYNVDMDCDIANLNVQTLSYAGLKITN